jgi:hypothetical protein
MTFKLKTKPFKRRLFQTDLINVTAIKKLKKLVNNVRVMFGRVQNPK